MRSRNISSQRKAALAAEVRRAAEDIARKGGTPLVVSRRTTRALGVIELKDIVKGGIRERFAELRAMGIRTVMITGDNPLTAAAIAAEAGVDDFLAQATPEAKLKLIRDIQAEGRLVAMCGDGTNDAPALAQADVAVAMNTGTQAAKEAGNMVDLDSNPTKLIEVVEIGKQMLITRGSLTTFSIANDVAKYFAIIPAAFASTYPALERAERDASGHAAQRDPVGGDLQRADHHFPDSAGAAKAWRIARSAPARCCAATCWSTASADSSCRSSASSSSICCWSCSDWPEETRHACSSRFVRLRLPCCPLQRAPAFARRQTRSRGNVAVVSDYMFRGITQTWGQPAIQGGGDLTMKNGFAAGFWASSISERSYPGGAMELDLYASYGARFDDDWSWRAGLYGYVYPGGNLDQAKPRARLALVRYAGSKRRADMEMADAEILALADRLFRHRHRTGLRRRLERHRLPAARRGVPLSKAMDPRPARGAHAYSGAPAHAQQHRSIRATAISARR